MSPVPDENPMGNLGEITAGESTRARQTIFSVSFLSSMPNSSEYRNENPSRCGSAAESVSEDDVDDEIINVTDDDVVMTTTENNSTANMLQVKMVEFINKYI